MVGAQLLLEGALVVLLAATLFHAMRLEKALGVLKRDRAVLEGLVTGFNDSTRHAEAGVERLRAATEGAGRQIARQIEQAQHIRHMRTGFADSLGQRFLRHAEFIEQALVAFRFFDRVEVLRCRFSTRAAAMVSTSDSSRTSTGTSCSPAFCDARQRRSPAMIW